MNIAIDNQEEGIMIKNPEGVYVPGKRKGGGWLKIKPEYQDGISDCLDLLVVGGSYGTGRHHNIISHFMCGILEKPLNESTLRKNHAHGIYIYIYIYNYILCISLSIIKYTIIYNYR